MLMDGHIFACIRFGIGFHSHPRTKWTSVIVSSCWLKKPDPVIGMQSISRFPQAACDSNSANNTSPMKNRFSAGSPRWLHVVQNAMRGRGAIFSAPAHAAQQESYFLQFGAFLLTCHGVGTTDALGLSWFATQHLIGYLLRSRGHVRSSEREIAACGRQVRSWDELGTLRRIHSTCCLYKP